MRLLWQAAMPASWPVLPAGIGQLGEGLVAQAGLVRVGFAALDTAGSIPLILAEPGYQRRGIGTGLLEAAVQQVRAGTAGSVTAGSGGARPVSAAATSAGPPASRSTAAPDTGPGGVMPCTPARPELHGVPEPLCTVASRHFGKQEAGREG